MKPDSELVAALRASPNHGERRRAGGPDMIILHYTGMESAEGALSWLADPASEVSSHYLVEEDGRIVQLVAEARRAWHAGQSSWRGETDVNSRSIGIEIVNPGHEHGYRPFPAPQVEAVTALCLDCGGRWSIPAENVLAHSDVAPARKQDPGELFPWGELAKAGVGHFVEASPIAGGRYFGRGDRGEPVEAYQSLLSAYGYDAPSSGVFDEATRFATIAFQRHFRPERVDGIADMSTVSTLHRLLKALPRSPFAEG